jgi:hypothetical protein
MVTSCFHNIIFINTINRALLKIQITFCIRSIIMAAAVFQKNITSDFECPAVKSQDFSASITTPSTLFLQRPRNVSSNVSYLKIDKDESPPVTNAGNLEIFSRPPQIQAVTVQDIHGIENQYTLDNCGFQIVKHKSKEKEFMDVERVKDEYFNEVEDLLKKVYVNNVSVTCVSLSI